MVARLASLKKNSTKNEKFSEVSIPYEFLIENLGVVNDKLKIDIRVD